EKTTFFYTEGHAIAPVPGGEKQFRSSFYLSCVEDTTLSVTDLDKIPEMFESFPKLQSLTLRFMEQDHSNTKDEFANFKNSTPEERYLQLCKNRPGLIQRVPQHQIASYLGVTPESLSRIRKRITEKEFG
ncbi:MAG: Crp/Fnr family transcriptional regulator, partial [Balneolaceae bacterium]